MGFKQIKGIVVTPVGPGNRHTPNKTVYWDKTGYAFGGWIYNTRLDIGYAKQPTVIELDIVLDAQTSTTPNTTNELTSANAAVAGISFDIVSGDLSARYLPASGECHYSIAVGSNIYSPMYLTSYSIEGTSDSKMLKTKFVDYSIVLDKIYVGLFKRQGYHTGFAKKLKTAPLVSAVCPDCSLSGADYWYVTGNFTGTVECGNYFYQHHGAYDLLPAVTLDQVYSGYFATRRTDHAWDVVEPLSATTGKFNINGGTLIIGCEEFNETACGDLAPVSYNFSELVLGLNRAGFRFSQVNSVLNATSWINHISGKIDKNPNYRQNYIGTLREVLNNWCADYALNFYVTGKTICFVDLTSGTLPKVELLRDSMIPVKPGGLLGPQFNSNTDFAIANYTESVDMSDTYEQNITTFDARPRKSEDKTKQIKNQCGFIAMHPLDFLGFNDTTRPNLTPPGHTTAYGEVFTGHYILNPIWDTNPETTLKNMPSIETVTVFPSFPGFPAMPPVPNGGSNNYYTSAGGCYRSHWYTQRPFILIDICAALGKYSKPLRDIFLGGLIATKFKEQLTAQTLVGPGATATEITAAKRTLTSRTLELRSLLNSFGFTPLIFLNELDYSDFKQSFIEEKFDKKTSDNRQSYLLNSINFEIAIGFHTQENEQEIFEWEQSIAENMYKYGVLVKGNLKKPPFLTPDKTDQPLSLAGLTGVSGLMVTKIESTTEPASEKYIDFFKLPFKNIYQVSGEYSNPIAKNMHWSGLSIAELENEWGTSQDDFNQKLKTLSPHAYCDNFKQGAFFTEDSYHSPPGFALEDFAPKFFEITDDLFDELESELRVAVANNPNAGYLLGKLIQVTKEKKIQVGGTDPNYTQYKCPKLKIMVIPNVSKFQTQKERVTNSAGEDLSELSPHLSVNFTFTNGVNPVMAANLNRTLEQRRLAKLKEIPKSICDTDLTTLICNKGRPVQNGKLPSVPAKAFVPAGQPFTVNGVSYPGTPAKPATSARPTFPLALPVPTTECREYSNNQTITSITGCQCVSEYTGDYSFGFETGRLKDKKNCRVISIDLLVNETARINRYLPPNSLFSVNSQGQVVVIADDEEFPTFTGAAVPLNLRIFYPVQSAPLSSAGFTAGLPTSVGHPAWVNGGPGTIPPAAGPFYNYYSGVLTTDWTIQVRSPEIIETHGNFWSGVSNVARIEQINNEVQQEVQQQINPITKGFFKPIYDMLGNIISSVSGYHNLITGMIKNSNVLPTLSLAFEIVGDAADITNFKHALTPASGLTNFSYSLGQEGYRSNVTFASRPAELPNREAILNKIRPRL